MAAKTTPGRVRDTQSVALTIGGSDSGGGAGIQADLKTFAALGFHGTSVITCITAQNPVAVLKILPVPRAMILLQLQAVLSEMRPVTIKTGMLKSASIVQDIANFLSEYPKIPLVVDPVMKATSGAELLDRHGRDAMVERLFPLATLVTPNIGEAETLLKRRIATLADMRSAAREIFERFGCAALVKGGHLPRARLATDVLFDGKKDLVVSGRFKRGIRTHGTGCVYSAAIAAYLGLKGSLPWAVPLAKRFVSNAIFGSRKVGQHWVLDYQQKGSRAVANL